MKIIEDDPPFDAGTSVRTTKARAAVFWTPEPEKIRTWGVKGIVYTHQDLHYRYYGVIHEDGSDAWYHASELEVLPGGFSMRELGHVGENGDIDIDTMA